MEYVLPFDYMIRKVRKCHVFKRGEKSCLCGSASRKKSLPCVANICIHDMAVVCHNRAVRFEDRQKTSCLRCGRTSVLNGRCRYCNCDQEEMSFLTHIPTLEGSISLHCPYVARVKDWSPCPGKTAEFLFSDFAISIGVAGNGPRSYLVGNRFKLQGRCPVCDNWYGDGVLLRDSRNIELLKKTWEKRNGLRRSSRQRTGLG